MKTIAVLTDFSARSEHAARYALHLAQKIKADVLLFNAFLVPAYAPAGTATEWQDESYEEIKITIGNKLQLLSKKIKHELTGKSVPGEFLPAISYQCEECAVANAIPELEDNKDIVLIVLATHGADDVSAFMMGDNCLQVIEAATIPLLIIPENAAIRNVEKFVFASDVIHDDIEYIKSLAGLAKQFSAEIMVANVNQHVPLTSEQENAINQFKDEIMHKINYLRIYYRSIPNNNVKKGLEWFIENVSFDMLVMVHRKRDLFEFFSKSSITKKIVDHAYIPLMVYPYPTSRIPSF